MCFKEKMKMSFNKPRLFCLPDTFSFPVHLRSVAAKRILVLFLMSIWFQITFAWPASALEVRQFTAVPSSGSVPLDVLLDVTTVSDRPATFMNAKWDFDDGTFATGFNAKQTVDHTYQEAGTYTPVFSFAELDGTLWEISATVTVDAPDLDVSLSASPSSGKVPLTVTFTSTATGGTDPLTYKIEFGDGGTPSSGTDTSVQHVYNKVGTYTATLTVTDDAGTEQTATVQVQVAEVPVELEAEADPDRGIAPLSTTFYVTVSEGTAPFTYTYDFGDGSSKVTGTDPSTTYTYSSAGNFSAFITVVDDTGSSGEVTVSVEVVSQATVSTTIDTLSKDAIPAVTDLDNLQTALTPIFGRVEKTLDYVAGLAATDPLRVSAEKTVLDAADRIFGQQVTAMTPLINAAVKKEDVLPVLLTAGQIASKMAAGDIPLAQKTVDSGTDISGLALQATLDDVLTSKGISDSQIQDLLSDPTKAQQFFSDKTNAQSLEDVNETVSVSIGAQQKITRGSVASAVTQLGFDKKVTDTVKNSLPVIVDVQRPVVESTSGAETTAQDLVNTILTSTSSVDTVTGVIQATFTDSTLEAMAVTSLGIIPDSLPQGLHQLPDGTRLGISSDFSVKFAPAAADPVSLSATIADAGLKTEFKSDGRILLPNFNGNESLVFGMSWDVEPVNSFQAGTVSFSVSGSDPSSAAFSLLVNYGNGTTQKAPNMINAKEPLLAFLESLIPGQYSLDLDTGILDVTGYGLKYKPDFIFESLTSIDFTSIQNAGGVVYQDIAFEIADYNTDGVMDLRYYSSDPMGRQILYDISN